MQYLYNKTGIASETDVLGSKQYVRSIDASHSQQHLPLRQSSHSQRLVDSHHDTTPANELGDLNVRTNVTSSSSSAQNGCLPYSCEIFRRCTECGRKQCRFFNFLNISSRCTHSSRICFSCLLLYICRQALTFRRDLSNSHHPTTFRRRDTDAAHSNHVTDNSRNSSGTSPRSSSFTHPSPTPVICPEPSCPHVMSGRLARYASSKLCQAVHGGSTDSSFVSTAGSSSTISSISTVVRNALQFDAESAAIAGLPRVCRACLRTEPDSFFRPFTSHCTHSPRLCTPCIHAMLRFHFESSASHNLRCPWPFCQRIVTPNDISRVYDPLSSVRSPTLCPILPRPVIPNDRLTMALNIADLTIPRASLIEELAVEVADEYQRRMSSAMCNCCHKVRRMSEFPFPVGWPCVHALYACQQCVAAQIPDSVRQALVERLGVEEMELENGGNLRIDKCEGSYKTGLENFRCKHSESTTGRSKVHSGRDDTCDSGNGQRGEGDVEKGDCEYMSEVTGGGSGGCDMRFFDAYEEPSHIPIVRCVAPKCGAMLPFAALASVDLTMARAVAAPYSTCKRLKMVGHVYNSVTVVSPDSNDRSLTSASPPSGSTHESTSLTDMDIELHLTAAPVVDVIR